jgi:carboxyl-terminal processing protease
MPLRNLVVLLTATLLAFACYQRASRNRFADTFSRAMNIVTADYVDEVEQRVLFEGAMNGMMDQLDMYSGYTPPREYLQFKEQIEGEFPGIGIMVEVDEKTKKLTVLAPLPGSPAAKAGIKSRDVIEAIDGHATDEQPLEKAIGRIKGPAGTSVKLTLRRPGQSEPLEVIVARAPIAIESVLGDARRDDGSWIYHLLDHPNLGYIRLDSFGERTADDFRQALDSLREPGQKIDGLILDLRGNEGGLLKAAVETCDMLIDEGVIVSTRGRGGLERDSFSATAGAEIDPDLPIVVLVDRYSASASEIMAGCLQDHHRAVVVGERSWGKGTVQNIEELEGGKSAIRLTIATYWRPSGKDIHKRRNATDADDWGVRPDADLEVKLTQDQYKQRVLARRNRDVTPLAELMQPKPAPVSPAESPTPSAVNPDAPPVPVPDPSEDAAAAEYVDPQLQRAIEYLRAKLDGQIPRPRAA